VKARDDELAAALWSAAYFFCLLLGYYILRPLREDVGATDPDSLAWLYLCSVTAMLLLHPVYAAIVARFPRRVFIPIVYRCFLVMVLGLFVLLKTLPDRHLLLAGQVFFVWLSVFNLFVVSVFWSFMADRFASEQGTRLFGFIGVGGTLGGLCGSLVTERLSGVMDPTNLMPVAAVMLELACWCVLRLNRMGGGRPDVPGPAAGDEPIRGTALGGMALLARSPYLLGISLFMLCLAITSTFLYFAQAHIVNEAMPERSDRVAFFARIDFLTSLLTVSVQVFLTGRIMGRIGVGRTLAVLPIVTLLGFGALTLSIGRLDLALVVWVLAALQVLRRSGNFALSRPAREVLYTVVGREEKYKSKQANDTFVYRGGDLLGAWGFEALRLVGLGLGVILVLAMPLAAGWLVLALVLGRRQGRLAAAAPGQNRPRSITGSPPS
jgi:AAA family ATP:ADP antiporter